MSNHKNTNAKTEKETSLGYVVKVQQVIDFMVLAELQKGPRYGKQLDQMITDTFQGVGVNDSYLAQRLGKLAENGHATWKWEDPDRRYNKTYRITETGEEYFRMLQQDLPDRVALAVKVYSIFDKTIKKFDR